MSEMESKEEECMEQGIIGRERAGRHLVWDTDVVYNITNMVVLKYLVWKQSRVSVPGGANRPLGRAVQYAHLQTKVGAIEGTYLAMTPLMTNQLLASCRSNVMFHLQS